MSKYTADEIEDTLFACLKAGDVDGIEICLRAMVGVDSARAVRLYDDLKVAVRVLPFLERVAPFEAKPCPESYGDVRCQGCDDPHCMAGKP